MVERRGPDGVRWSEACEAEPVIVDTSQDEVVLELDDGNRLVFDALELRTAVNRRLRSAA
jgi:hypothetical protein